MTGRIPILDVEPSVGCGRWPAHAVPGEVFPVSATVFREGHDAVDAGVVLIGPDGQDRPLVRLRLVDPGHDRWEASVAADSEGSWSFRVEGWGDPVASWVHAAAIKIPARIDVELMCEEGAVLLERAASERTGDKLATARTVLLDAVHALRDTERPPEARLAAALDPAVSAELERAPLREFLTATDTLPLWVDRKRALVGSWYEMFPRSEGSVVDPTGEQPPKSGTFRTAAERLPAVAAMGFDVVYLPPIHPIGTTARKGPNNTLAPGPHDPGVPWAIGSPDGGHDAIHPDLGTIDDFDAFVARTRELGMEVALDFALQTSPDHPWVTKHPEWFTTLTDGSIAYAENPPKKYQDIYPLNFDNDPEGIYAEILRVLRHWMSHGVRVFRVDNPHTKPVAFWEGLLKEVRETDPDVLFLAEAFTRPAMMHTLGKIGFHQSYTYFTWRNGKAELEEYLTELSGAAASYMRPNFFVNTPDILHEYLQYGGPPAFKVRAVLASMLSPTWGMYAGYELFEHVAVRPGSEEYLDSEKYQYRPRDWGAAEHEGRSLAPYITLLNRIRREHPSLQQLRQLHFHRVDNDAIIAFSKTVGRAGGAEGRVDAEDTVLVVVNLDPHTTREATISLDLPALGADWQDTVSVHDEITGHTWRWGQFNYVRLDPFYEPAHILTVRRNTA